jgi:F0F1-type ATP synthase assembly protein I
MIDKKTPLSKWLAPIVGVVIGAGLGYKAARSSGEVNVSLPTFIIGGAILGGVAGLVMLLIDHKKGR